MGCGSHPGRSFPLSGYMQSQPQNFYLLHTSAPACRLQSGIGRAAVTHPGILSPYVFRKFLHKNNSLMQRFTFIFNLCIIMNADRRLPILALATIALMTACNDPEEKQKPVTKPVTTTTTIEKKVVDSPSVQKDTIADRPVFVNNYSGGYTMLAKDSFKTFRKTLTSNELRLVAAVNRIDVSRLSSPDSVLLPLNLKDSLAAYFPFPAQVEALAPINKIIFFSYPTQAFAAYGNGRLIYTGPTSMGKAKTKTPTGLFFANWKSKETISTVNEEWKLKWNFNVANLLGVGFHQYELPGYPASHACMRLRESDAKLLYSWTDQWKLQGDTLQILHGTPVIIYGQYPFGKRRPWYRMANGDSLKISESDIAALVQPHMNKIMGFQKEREDYAARKTADTLYRIAN